MATIKARIEDLENATRAPGKGFIVVNIDPEDPGVYWEKFPFGDIETRGKRYTKDDLTGYDQVIYFEYVKDWRGEHGN